MFEPHGRVEPNKPTMYYYIHLDILGDTAQPTRKRRKLDTFVEVEEVSSAEESEEAEEIEELESGDEGFHLLEHTIVEEETESCKQEEDEEEEQQGGLRAQWKSMRIKFMPSKLASAHLVPQEALAVASLVGDVRPVGVLFQKISEGEPPAQRRVSLPQISLAVLAAKIGMTTGEIGTAGTGMTTTEIATAAAGTSTTVTEAGTMAIETGTTSANLEAALGTMINEDIDASLDGWLG